MKSSILLIDDKPELMSDLAAAIEKRLSEPQVEIRRWTPVAADLDPQRKFHELVDRHTVIVVTDHDLTEGGRTGLLGSSIVGWCQALAIPVGDFSRANPTQLPREPNFFELRVPSETEEAALFVGRAFRGFREIGRRLEDDGELVTQKRSPAAVLAAILDAPELEGQLAMYGVSPSSTNAALFERVTRTSSSDSEPDLSEKRLLVAYIVGHVLLNAVLRYCGPILSRRCLMAYVGCDESEASSICGEFRADEYFGPFSSPGEYFWLSRVDARLADLTSRLPATLSPETHGELHRRALELHLDRALVRHKCERCNGENGGFLCPFTGRTVCQRADCSVGANSWIPQGARLCRIERSFYEEWAPIFGV